MELMGWLLDWFSRYPSYRAEEIATPYRKEMQEVAQFDYIIVGGGTAGCVLANRLSANPLVTVLLLERGEVADTLLGSNPTLSHPLFPFVKSKAIKTVPQPELLNKEEVVWESISLGGKTRINGGLYLQGCPAEYDSWGKGWKWKDVAPYFARSEGRLEVENGATTKILRNEGREWKTKVVKAQFENTRRFEQALNSLGVPSIESYTDPDTPTCFGLYQRRSVQSNGRRCSTYHAFLPKALVQERPNLFICLGAHVQKVLFTNEEKSITAKGVLLESGGRLYAAEATHEIILCGGAIVTPQLLLLSGIGPKDHLKNVDKPCLHDLPGVGSTLQDHVYVPLTFITPFFDSAHPLVTNPFRAILALLQFFIFGTGCFVSMISEYFCFFHSDNLPPNHDKNSHALPDLELFWTAAYGASVVPPLPKGKGGGSLMVQNTCPVSVGTIRLSREGANDVKVDPVVDPKLLSDPSDWEVYRRGIPFAIELAKKMRESGYEIEPADVPASLETKDIDDFVRSHAWASQHYTSSCRMKPLEEGGVVDQQLRVYGVKNLRIADASVFPAQVASRPQATVVMIAERCADFIRQEWNAPEIKKA